MTAISALATATIARPDGAIPPTLEAAVRAACAGAWRAVEVVLAGDALRARLGTATDARVREGVEAVLGMFETGLPTRGEALTELRAARRAGALDGALDMNAVAASCARVGESPVIAAGRRRVRAHAIDQLRRELADHRALAAAVGDAAVVSLLVDAARAVFRHAVKADKDLAKWAMAVSGTNTRDRALTTFAELATSTAAVEALDRLIATPVKLDENVQFTVYRPRAIEPRTWHPLLAFAHLAERRPDEQDTPDPVAEVRKQAEAVLGERAKAYQPVVQDSSTAIPVDGELTFVPEIAGVEFNPPRRSFLWLEPVHREDFRMRAGAELDGTTARGRLTVFLGHIAIAEIALSVRVDAARPEPAVQEVGKARTYRKIFASYSHRDVAIVNQFEQYARALGDEYLRDWIHLRTGEVWNDRLRQLIEQADAFQLFWSWNALGSKFVQLEYEHALSLNRPSFVRPTYWEEPMPTAPGLPPEALLRLHFQKIGGAVTSVIGAGSRADAAAAAPAAPAAPVPAPARAAAAPSLPRAVSPAPDRLAEEHLAEAPSAIDFERAAPRREEAKESVSRVTDLDRAKVAKRSAPVTARSTIVTPKQVAAEAEPAAADDEDVAEPAAEPRKRDRVEPSRERAPAPPRPAEAAPVPQPASYAAAAATPPPAKAKAEAPEPRADVPTAAAPAEAEVPSPRPTEPPSPRPIEPSAPGPAPGMASGARPDSASAAAPVADAKATPSELEAPASAPPEAGAKATPVELDARSAIPQADAKTPARSAPPSATPWALLVILALLAIAAAVFFLTR